MKNYACIKGNVVENVIVIDENDTSIVDLVKEAHGYDQMVCSDGLYVEVGDTYDGSNFINKDDEVITIVEVQDQQEIRNPEDAPALGVPEYLQ